MPHKPVCDIFALSSALLSVNTPPRILLSLLPLFSHQLSPLLPPLFGSTTLRRSGRFRNSTLAPFVELSSKDYSETRETSRMIKSEFHGESTETPRPRKRNKVTRKKQTKARAQAPASQESFLLPSALLAEVFEKCWLREKLEVVPRSVLEFYFWSLKMYTNRERP